MKKFLLSVIATCAFFLAGIPAAAAEDSGDREQVTLETGVEKETKVYPNPVAGGALLTIDFPGESREVTVYLYNTVGQVVRTVTLTGEKTELNAPDVGGMYLLRFVEKQKVIAVEKIVVKE